MNRNAAQPATRTKTMTTPQPKRRFFRYSLRTLMLAVTLFCILMGVVVKRARDQQQAVAAIRAVGGRVFYEHQNVMVRRFPFQYFRRPLSGPQSSEPPGPMWLRQLMGDEYFFNVDAVFLDGPKINDASLAAIGRLPDVKWVSLHTTRVTNVGIAHLRGMTNLQFLELSSTQVTDAGLENLKGLTNLQALDLYNTKITDAGLEHLKGLTNLSLVEIKYTYITDKGIKKLKQELPNCLVLR